MDYDHLFAYLETRPIEEKNNCMHRIIDLVRRHTSEDTEAFDTSSEERIILKANVMQAEISKILMEKHVWTQQAVWNKFGTRSAEITNPTELSDATSPLLTEPDVARYILAVNNTNAQDYNHNADGHGHFAKKARQKLETNFGTITRDALHMASIVPPQSQRRISAASVSSVQYSPRGDETEHGSSDDARSNGTSEHSGRTGTSRKRCRKYRKLEDKPRARWTTSSTDALVQAVHDHKDDKGWSFVAQTVGGGVSVKQCYAKWHIMKSQQNGLKPAGTKWTEDEIRTLNEAVQQHKSQTSDGSERTSWLEVSRTVGRSSAECRNKYVTLHDQPRNREPSTAAEND